MLNPIGVGKDTFSTQAFGSTGLNSGAPVSKGTSQATTDKTLAPHTAPSEDTSAVKRALATDHVIHNPKLNDFTTEKCYGAMRELLIGIMNERSKHLPVYKNPWAGMSPNQYDEFVRSAIDSLAHIRTRDLSVAMALHLDGKEAELSPYLRLQALKANIEKMELDQKTPPRRSVNSPDDQSHLQRLKHEVKIVEEALNNRAHLTGKLPDAVTQMNIRTAHVDNGEKKGYVRLYMTVFVPSMDDKYKDLHKSEQNGLDAKSNRLWIGIGTPARALSYAQSYRLQEDPARAPVIRSVLVKQEFLDKHLPKIVTEDNAEQNAPQPFIDKQIKDKKALKGTAIKAQPLMNVDHKVPNQFGMSLVTDHVKCSIKRKPDVFDVYGKVDRLFGSTDEEAFKTNKEQIQKAGGYVNAKKGPSQVWKDLLEYADPDSFQTICAPEEFDEIHDSTRDGEQVSMQSLATQIGLSGNDSKATMHLLRGGKNPATAFHIFADDKKWRSMNNAELDSVVKDANALFDMLDAWSNNPKDNTLPYLDLVTNVGDLLEANRMTPGALLKPPKDINSKQRDYDGNSAVKTQLENTFSEKYFESNIWHADMAEWSKTLAAYIDKNKVKFERNWYIERDLKVLAKSTSTENKDESNVDQRTHIRSELNQLSRTLKPGNKALNDDDRRRVALFFHVLREVSQKAQQQASQGDPNVNVHVIPKLHDNGKTVQVNNREKLLSAFDVMNPKRGAFGWPADRMQSTKRFTLDKSNPLTEYMEKLDAPFIGGVSGTTRDICKSMNSVLGEMKSGSYWKFQMLNASFMVKSNYHSMFETLYVAARYDKGDEDTRGKKILQHFDELAKKNGGSKPDDLYSYAITCALGNEGERLWNDARSEAFPDKTN